MAGDFNGDGKTDFVSEAVTHAVENIGSADYMLS